MDKLNYDALSLMLNKLFDKIETWVNSKLDSKDYDPFSLCNQEQTYIERVSQFVEWAKKMGYLPKDFSIDHYGEGAKDVITSIKRYQEKAKNDCEMKQLIELTKFAINNSYGIR